MQTSLLPHLSGLEATEGRDAFAPRDPRHDPRDRRFAGAVAIGLLLIGPPVMDIVFGDDSPTAASASRSSRSAWASTSAPARSTRPRSPAAATAPRRRVAGSPRRVFVAWMLAPVVDDQLVRAEVGYAGAAALLCALLAGLYARGD